MNVASALQVSAGENEVFSAIHDPELGYRSIIIIIIIIASFSAAVSEMFRSRVSPILLLQQLLLFGRNLNEHSGSM